jgi:sphinganine-1-phosphate aldolase
MQLQLQNKHSLQILLFFSLVYKRNDIIRNIYYLKNFLFYENKKELMSTYFYNIFYSLPLVKDKVNIEIDTFNTEMKKELDNSHKPFINIIPSTISEDGLDNNDIYDKLNKLKNSVEPKNINYVSGTIYSRNNSEIQLMGKILPIFFKSNPLHPEIFPQISFLEKTIIKSVSKLFHGNNDTVGSITSGGTESILCACYAYKNYGLKKGIKNPEIIAPISIHAAFDKAADYFGIKIHKIPIYDDNSIDFNIVKSYINNNTILLACSAPSYAHGLIDDIEEFSNIAVKYNIPLHVDACLGGFLLPFVDNLGFKYDFELPGVTSISADTHKYGYTPKGSSILLYRNETYYKNQVYVQSKWNGGIYATPTIPGSRSGNNIVFTWAFLNSYGINGYKEKTKQIVDALYKVKNKLITIEEIEVIGNPILNVIGIKSDIIDIYSLNSEMKKYGWEINELQNPASLHYCVTLNNCEDSIIDKLYDNMIECIGKIKCENYRDIGKSIYGSTQKINNVKIVDQLAKQYIKNLFN